MVEPTIHREIWEGKVPVCFGVAEEEVQENMRGDKVTPEPCYVSQGPRATFSGCPRVLWCRCVCVGGVTCCGATVSEWVGPPLCVVVPFCLGGVTCCGAAVSGWVEPRVVGPASRVVVPPCLGWLTGEHT